MEWKTVLRPGYFGKKREEKHKAFDDEFGEGNWRIVWLWNGGIIFSDFAYSIYEDGYYHDSFNRPEVWKELINAASEIYDHVESDVESGFDYRIQKSSATHLQDIAIRRVIFRRGWKFQGRELVQIRGFGYWGKKLSPGRVPFHIPDMIFRPHFRGWWDDNTVEDFYQSNKVVQVRG